MSDENYDLAVIPRRVASNPVSPSFKEASMEQIPPLQNWANLVAFYFVDGAPATNNPLENYYSSSLKTHRKNQLDITGIEEQIKLSRLNRWGMFGIPQKTLLEAFFVFIPFMDWK
jgi:hypothetical protein